jgi:hypothetical protein
MAAINCPITGAFSASGSGDAQSVKLYDVTLTVDETFTVNENPFTFFDLSENGEIPGTSGTAGYKVSINNVVGLTAALQGWLKTTAKNSANQTVKTHLLEHYRAQINAILAADDLGAMLETQQVGNLQITTFETPADAAVVTLVNALEGSQADKNLIGLQFPQARYAGDSYIPGTLPYQAGDSLMFKFVITSTITVNTSEVSQTSTNPGVVTEDTPQTALPNLTVSGAVRSVGIKALVPA